MDTKIAQEKTRLATDKGYAAYALTTLWDLQTRDEQRKGETIYDNGWGLNQTDAPVAAKIIAKMSKFQDLDASDYRQVTYRMPKYAAQLVAWRDMGEAMGWPGYRVTKSGLEFVAVA